MSRACTPPSDPPAVGELVDRHDSSRITALLDAVHAEHGSALDPQIAAMQFLSLGADEEW